MMRRFKLMVERDGCSGHIFRRAGTLAVQLSFLFMVLLLPSELHSQYLFEPSICIAGGELSQFSPSLALNSTGDPYVAYVNEYPPWYIEFVRSTDGGHSFCDPVQVAWDRPYIFPSLAVYHDDPYLVYIDGALECQDVYFTRSTDGGESFLEPLNIGKSDRTELAVDRMGNPSIACRRYRMAGPGQAISCIALYRSTDGGNSFLEPSITDSLPYYLYHINLAIDSAANPHIAWAAGSWWEILHLYYTRSTDGGETFLPPCRLIDDTGGNCAVDIQISRGCDPCIVWSSVQKGATVLHYTRSTDGGTSFLPPTTVDSSSSGTEHPSLALNPQGNPLVAWADSRHGICTAHSTDGGTTFSSASSVDSTGSSQSHPTLGLGPDGATAHLAWTDDRHMGGSDIYYTYGSPLSIVGKGIVPQATSTYVMNITSNPFHQQVTIQLTAAPRHTRAILSIYNIAGQTVRTMHTTTDHRGCCQFTWDGRSNHGGIQACGVYLCHLTTGGKEMTIKLLKLP
jgi:hypothetical protein